MILLFYSFITPIATGTSPSDAPVGWEHTYGPGPDAAGKLIGQPSGAGGTAFAITPVSAASAPGKTQTAAPAVPALWGEQGTGFGLRYEVPRPAGAPPTG